MRMPLGITGCGNEQSDILLKNHKNEIIMKVKPKVFVNTFPPISNTFQHIHTLF